ncbi:MAG TPA: DNA repair protein RecO [Planctomycetota bacterium]|nr:DNA repair protein RecO [Planctomycetota bacterium]
MKDAGVETEALVLKRFDFSETSQIARLYTRRYGRVSVLAKGSRRPNPNLLGPLDAPALAEATVVLKTGDRLSLLTRYRVKTGFPGLRSVLERLVAAFHLAELLLEGVRDLDPDPAMFDDFVAGFAALEIAPPEGVAAVVLRTTLGYLRRAGFAPAFDRCVACDAVAPPEASVRFSPGRGGVLCRRCLDPTTPGLVTISAARRRTLRALEACTPAEAATVPLPEPDRLFFQRTLGRTVEHALEKELKSAPFVERTW